MTDTSNIGLPLLAPSQAQKHVTVNEALVRLDAVTQMTVQSRTQAIPPVFGQDGDVYVIPDNAQNDWESRSGQLAIYSNGGWIYVLPKPGWRCFVIDEGAGLTNAAAGWVEDALAVSTNGAATRSHVLEFDQVISAGASVLCSETTPNNAIVLGITGRITQEITGTFTDWQLGISGSENRYGSGLGGALGSYVHGLTSSPLTYYSGLRPLLSANGGDFASGTVRLAIHYQTLSLPSGD